MAKETNLYVYVKGKKGQFAYVIADIDFNIIHRNHTELSDPELSPVYAELEAILAALKYIVKHQGKDDIPSQPMMFIYTSHENNYTVAAGLKEAKAECFQKYIDKIDALKQKLTGLHGSNEVVKFYWIPKKFENNMDEVEALFQTQKLRVKL